MVISELPIELLGHGDDKLILRVIFDKRLEEIVDHRDIDTFTNIKILLNSKIQDDIYFLELYLFVDILIRWFCNDPEYEIEVRVDFLFEYFVDKDYLSPVWVCHHHDGVVAGIEELGKCLLAPYRRQSLYRQVSYVQELDDHWHFVSQDKQIQFVPVPLVPENTCQGHQFHGSQLVCSQIRIPNLIDCLHKILVVVYHFVYVSYAGNCFLLQRNMSQSAEKYVVLRGEIV